MAHRATATIRGTIARLRLFAAFARAMVVYWLTIWPRTRTELRRWRQRALAIPDPLLRHHALDKLDTEHLTAEGAAAFGILAARRRRREAVRLCVAWEVLYDFVDGLGELPLADVTAHNRQLYQALVDALIPTGDLGVYYAHLPSGNDGGYVAALAVCCRQALLRLPAHAAIAPSLARLAELARDAQVLHHASSRDGSEALRSWARQHEAADVELELEWWEIAAAAGSPLGIFALVAAATFPDTTRPLAELIERAYFPSIMGLSWLLESLVDHGDDDVTAHSYVAHYQTPAIAGQRLAAIAERAARDADALPHARDHHLLLAGMVAMNLSHPGARSPFAAPAVPRVVTAVGGALRPLLFVLRMRRRADARPAANAREALAGLR